MKKWEEISKDELETIFNSEGTYEGIQIALGYKYRAERNEELKAYAENLGIDTSRILSIKKKDDIRGQVFQHLQVLEYDTEKSGHGNGRYWYCKCLDCGKIYPVKTKSLCSNKQINCGCTKSLNILGKTFGFLTPIEKCSYTFNRNVMYKCKCKCGNEIIASATKLNQGLVKSCGCMAKSDEYINPQIIDLTGQQFGYLKVLSYNKEESRIRKRTQWNCLCTNCNTETIVSSLSLKSGCTISCGCIRSRGEAKIIKFLQDNNITYKKEVSFSDLSVDHKLRFDFGIYNQEQKLIMLIEYNGIQHYEAIPHFGGQTALEKQQYYDSLKVEYCKQKNIPLLIFNKENENFEEILEVIKCQNILNQ